MAAAWAEITGLIRILTLVLSHLGFAGLGFALGIYALPILMAPDAPFAKEMSELEMSAIYGGEFKLSNAIA